MSESGSQVRGDARAAATTRPARAIAVALVMMGCTAAFACLPIMRLGVAPGALVIDGVDRTDAFLSELKSDPELVAEGRGLAEWLSLGWRTSTFTEHVGRAESGAYELIIGPPASLTQLDPELWSVFLQERREGDVWDSRPGGQGIMRQPVLAARPELAVSWEAQPDTRWRNPMETLVVGVRDPSSPEGFVAPLNYLESSQGLEGGRDFYRQQISEEDAFMALANGMIDVAAFSRGEFERLSAQHRERTGEAGATAPVVVVELPPVPSPAVCFHVGFFATHSRKHLAVLAGAMQRAVERVTDGVIRYVPATDAQYERIVADARAWYEAKGIRFGLPPAKKAD